MSEVFHVVPRNQHDTLVQAAYRKRGYNTHEAGDAAHVCSEAARHGIRTHNALKALHLDDHFGSGGGNCVPGAEIERIDERFTATETWNCNRKLGQSVAVEAMATAMKLADEHGVGVVSCDNAFHYLWGGGYVMDAARKGYIAYTNCTSALAEVVPFGGKFPTLGTNPHSWGFPTTEALGYPVVMDWATSTIAMGRVEQFKREKKELPPGAAVDKDGNPTTDPFQVAALLPFGAHKGYGLALLNELFGAAIGGSLPTLRGHRDKAPEGEKTTTAFYFQVIHPEALSGQDFASGRSQSENLAAVLKDIFGHGNEDCLLPGTLEHRHAERCKAAGGLLFSPAEIEGFRDLAEDCGQDPSAWDLDHFPVA